MQNYTLKLRGFHAMYTIAVCGIDRIGKTTLSENLAKYLKWDKLKFPNYSLDSGQRIDWMLQGKEAFDPEYFQLLQNQNKLETLSTLPDGKYIFDRYKLSEIIYGIANGLPEAWVRKLAAKVPDPDLTIVLHGKPHCQDRSIFKDAEYQNKVSELYFQECRDKCPKKYILVDVDGKTPDDVLDFVIIMLKLRGIDQCLLAGGKKQ
jgi:thymidylate kinase